MVEPALATGGNKMIYVALLRGINVGGNNKIDMKELKETFEDVGMESVTTYINSGNIIFTDSSHSRLEIERTLEKAIMDRHMLNIKVLVRSLDDFDEMMKALPGSWKNDKTMKSNVIFLVEGIDNGKLLDELSIKEGIDTVKYVPGAILWMVDKKNSTKSGMLRLVGTKIYRDMTIRNVNTVRKIYEIMKGT